MHSGWPPRQRASPKGAGPRGEHAGDLTLTGATLTDPEEVSIFNDNGTPRVIIGAFGDNGASRTTKQLFIFDEPVVTGSNITIPNDGSYEQVDFVYPASPLWAGGNNRGDAETMFVADGKIYIISKREAVPKLFSLPVQSSYSGTQTLTYEGEIYDIPDSGGSPVTPGNAVGGCMSADGLHVLIKTYDTVWGWSRTSAATDIPTLLNQTPTEYPYVGLGAHPAAEPQGESICFSHDDQAYFTVSETGTGSTATNFPIFVHYRSNVESIQETSVQEGLNGYSGTEDTYINVGENDGVNYGSDPTIIADEDASDDRYAFLKFGGLDTALGSNQTVIGSALVLDIANEGMGFDIYKLTTDWTEGTVTGTSFGSPAAGVDYDATPIGGTTGLDTRTGSIEVAIDPATVQDWYENPSTNYGMLFISRDTDGLQFSSKDNGTQSLNPLLKVQHNPDPNLAVVTFQNGANSYTGAEDTYWWSGIGPTPGNETDYSSDTDWFVDVNPADERRGYLKFAGLENTIPAGATITSAELDLHIENEGQGLSLYKMLVAVNDTDTDKNLQDAGYTRTNDGTFAAVATGGSWPGDDGNVDIDITITLNATGIAMVQDWLDNPSNNHGMLFLADHASDGQSVSSSESATQAYKPLLRVTYSTS
jgi:hypothetical protein